MKPQIVLQHDETDCAPACLASIMRYYGKNVAINRIRNIAGTDSTGTTGLGIIRGAESFGFSCKGLCSPEKKIKEYFPFPFIAHIKKEISDHYVVVYKVTQKSILIADPAIGIEKIPIEVFKEKWSGVFFILSPTDGFKKISESQGLFSRFLHLLLPYKKILGLAFIASISMSLLGVATAFYFRFLIDDILYSQLNQTRVQI